MDLWWELDGKAPHWSKTSLSVPRENSHWCLLFVTTTRLSIIRKQPQGCWKKGEKTKKKEIKEEKDMRKSFLLFLFACFLKTH